MNIVKRTIFSSFPQLTIKRGLRRLQNRSKTSEKNALVSECPNIPAFQVPLTEQELRAYVDRPSEVSVKETSLKKSYTSLKEKIKPEVNPPIVEPITIDNQHERLAEVVTPLYQMPYNKQMVKKERKIQEVLKSLGERLVKVGAPIRRLKRGLPCAVESLRPSPDIIGYRNKDEFGIHFGVDGNPKTVGFFVGKPTDPLMTCVPATYLLNMKESHKHIAKRFQTFIQQSPYEACHRFDIYGIWRNLLVRSTRHDERLATVYIHPQDLAEDQILEIMGDLEKFFFHGEGADCELDSLYLQAGRHTRSTREQAPYRLIHGKEQITEICEGLSFHISPDSFFQINTGGAEVLYRTIREIAEVSPITTLLDVCSGTGTISLVMAPFVRGAVGIESVTSAVEDARRNAAVNNVSNTQFIAGKAEEALPRITRELSYCTDVVAIVNPARGGLKAEVINSIRQCEAINKLIYVSCKPEGVSMQNFVQLCATKGKGAKQKNSTPPFVPRYAVPVDLFPHTHHSEIVILFERVTA